ncbi:MAG: DUF6048 family protein [Barnesiella sp.]
MKLINKLILITGLLTCTFPAYSQRRVITPVEPGYEQKYITQTAVDSVAPEKEEEKPPKIYPLFNGIMIGINVFDPIANLCGQKYGNYEIGIEVDLLNRFFPVWEIGIGHAKSTPEDMNFTYLTKGALYNRIGLNYNFKYKSDSPSFFYIGLRYGFSMFSYDINDITMNSPYWEESQVINIPDQKSHAHWLEGLVGLRVQIYKNFFMGWSVRYKYMLSYKKNINSDPWFIPGYGTKGSSLGFTYNLMYRLPIKGKISKAKPEIVGDTKK